MSLLSLHSPENMPRWHIPCYNHPKTTQTPSSMKEARDETWVFIWNLMLLSGGLHHPLDLPSPDFPSTSLGHLAFPLEFKVHTLSVVVYMVPVGLFSARPASESRALWAKDSLLSSGPATRHCYIHFLFFNFYYLFTFLLLSHTLSIPPLLRGNFPTKPPLSLGLLSLWRIKCIFSH